MKILHKVIYDSIIIDHLMKMYVCLHKDYTTDNSTCYKFDYTIIDHLMKIYVCLFYLHRIKELI